MSILEHRSKSIHIKCLKEPIKECDSLNCCVSGFMSKCGAGPLAINQRACRFFKLSSCGDRCMHYCVALDGHCDSVDAQREMKNRERSLN
jgi:hypothetical protein